MIEIINKNNCCGCEACVQACPKQCISFEADGEGFCYPKVDKLICVECGACERSCPNLSPFDSSKPKSQIAAINPNNIIREESSSGGIFTMLSEKVIEAGGVVFGVRFDEQWQAVFDYTDTLEGLAAFRGSKYIQARVGQAFVETRAFLKEGRKVLFTGTPCQIAAIRHFLKRDYDNLLLVDFVCHGVPSPKVWKIYLNEVTDNAENAIKDIRFRNKRQGWKHFNFDLTYDRESKHYSISSWHLSNHFMRIFLKDVILRPSCYACSAKGGRSGSDVTIADFWGIDKMNPQMDDDKGTSLVLVNTDKGSAYVDELAIKRWETSYEDVVKYNPAIEHSAKEHAKRAYFFSKLDSSPSVVNLIDDTLRAPFSKRIKITLKRVAGKIFYTLTGRIGGGKFDNKEIIKEIPTKTQNESVYLTTINFRSKQYGWKRYKLNIKLSSR